MFFKIYTDIGIINKIKEKTVHYYSDVKKAAAADAEKHASPTQPEVCREAVIPLNNPVNTQATLLIPSQPQIPVTAQGYPSRPATARLTRGMTVYYKKNNENF